jgi:S-DNA-T family DNA segregation ATPase FtsK/SpoIIIE
MLYMAGGGRVTQVHGPFVSDEEVERVVSFLKSRAEPDYIDEITEDDSAALDPLAGDDDAGSGNALYDQAVALVCRERKASTSFVQRPADRLQPRRPPDRKDGIRRRRQPSQPRRQTRSISAAGAVGAGSPTRKGHRMAARRP